MALGWTAPAQAQELKIGIMAVLSGPQAVLGGQLRDGFMLGVKHAGGKLGGLATTVTVQDDELKPDVAVGKAKQLIERDKVDFVVGPVFSNILMAIHRPITDAKVFLISPNAGPSPLAGKGCSPFFFATSYQNDQPPEVLGKYAQDKGFKKAFLLAPNYQAGKDMIGGFKKHFKGEIADEVYTPLGQLDFAAELAKIAAAKPDAFFVFMPGGMGVNLVKQYRQAGLDNIPFLSVFTVDEATLPAQQDAAVGFFSGMTWAPNLDTPENKKFVADFQKQYPLLPDVFTVQQYDGMRALDEALKALGGDTSDKDKFVKALEDVSFKSPRGDFAFDKTTHNPIQDIYIREVKTQNGQTVNTITDKVAKVTDPGK